MEVTLGAVSEHICPLGTRLTSRSHLLLQVLDGAQLCKQGWGSFSSHLSGVTVQSRDPGLVMGLTTLPSCQQHLVDKTFIFKNHSGRKSF